MKKNLLLAMGIVVWGIGSCTAQKKTSGKPVTTAQSHKISAVTMTRTPCFGRCPFYSIEIRPDGTVTYRGMRFTELSGVYTHNIGATKAGAILDQFNAYRADTCQDRYNMLITDVPSLNYTLAVDTGNKKIINANFGPSFLKDLSMMIDQVGQADKSWKKVADSVTAE